jgi:ubiquinone/menaquinone biosynthesis C-methylase UbiE
VSRVALDRARERLGAGVATVELEPDAPLPFDDGSFDLALVAETIEHVRDVQLLLSELRRVLVPGGLLALTTPAAGFLVRPEHPFSPHLRRFTRASLRGVLEELGFDVESLRRRRGTLLALARR